MGFSKQEYLESGGIAFSEKKKKIYRGTNNKLIIIIHKGFPGGSDGKESACKAGD